MRLKELMKIIFNLTNEPDYLFVRNNKIYIGFKGHEPIELKKRFGYYIKYRMGINIDALLPDNDEEMKIIQILKENSNENKN